MVARLRWGRPHVGILVPCGAQEADGGVGRGPGGPPHIRERSPRRNREIRKTVKHPRGTQPRRHPAGMRRGGRAGSSVAVPLHNLLRVQYHVVMVTGRPRVRGDLQELEWAQGRGSHAVAAEPEVFHIQILTQVHIQIVNADGD